ncbi:MAG: hypothetical protein ACYCVE_08435 [Gemmatimonadaceae bacterium]
MTSRDRVRGARRLLIGLITTAALVWAAAAAMVVIAVAAGLDKLVPLPYLVRAALIPVGLAAAFVAGAAVLWRGRGARSMSGVALWIEEQDPTLRYALVTAIDPAMAPAADHAELHRLAERADIDRMLRRAIARTLGSGLLVAAALAAALALLHPGRLLRAAESALSGGRGSATAVMANRLDGFTARVVPPAYARMSATTLREPGDVPALIGTAITYEGKGRPDGITGATDSASFTAADGPRGWAIATMMPKTPTVLVLHDRGYKALIALEPRVDSAPNVRLLLPQHDTTYQAVPKTPLEIQSTFTDDIGLNFAYVEYMISTGSGEDFKTKVVDGPRIAFNNSRSGAINTVIRLDTMKLTPGTVLDIRVVAYDYNDVTGPGIGVSESRTLKIAEPIDSTSINSAPPLPIDTLWMSQRLLNMKTDTLIRTALHHSHADFAHTSSGYSNAQESIRQRAIAVIGLLENNGEGSSFQTDVSKMLRTAVDLMWTAREDLGIAQPKTAMPYMIKILKILDEIRLANRYYLRGIMPPVPVDIARVRLTGKEKVKAGPLGARAELPDPHAALAARLDAVAALVRSSPGAAADSLVYIRVSALTSAPSVAAPLQRAIDLLRKRQSADSALAGARLALQPPARVLHGPAEWGGGSP